MGVVIRRCMISDTDTIVKFCKDELGYPFSPEQIQENIRRLIGETNSLILVAELNGEVIGFVHASNHEPIYAPPMKNIMAIVIAERYRKQGLGERLLNEVEAWAKETGAAGIRVNSPVWSDAALRFYKHMGFDYIKSFYNFRKMFKKNAD